jgi:hypothetical protein
MRSILRITIYMVFATIFVLHPAIMFAQEAGQSGSSVSITASARVVGDIELITISDMGLLEAILLQESNEILINPVFDPEAGIMKARGTPDAPVRVSYLAEREVTRMEGPGTLMFYYMVSGYPGDNQRESELLDPAIERELRFDENGEFYFWIGGRVSLENALPGSYQGEFTIEIEYI